MNLTAEERADLLHHIGAWKFQSHPIAIAEAGFFRTVERIVAARLAAAWDEGYRHCFDLDDGAVSLQGNPYRTVVRAAPSEATRD